MARTALVGLVAVVAVAVLSSTAHAQQSQQSGTAVQETPGLLERIMTDYVYPLRDMDWRVMLRSALENMMNYIAPDAKEPKVGGLPQTRNDADIASLLGFLLEHFNLMESERNRRASRSAEETQRKGDSRSEASHSDARPRERRSGPRVEAAPKGEADPEKSRETGRLFVNANSNVSSSVAGHSWAYLSMLIFYCGFSIFGALLPLYKMARDEILEATGSEGNLHNHVETGNIFQI
ncbi:uncharacterized protein LOC122252996 [Penaeus japonicus]|uniref:uncharacterized protein LOC122252996 n=1 Tax=Penaeus japonicus TaxID=27405 RepID=UPI001C717142|nr:uncharacterized protein LOC122252996 [Penaeus japonicus]